MVKGDIGKHRRQRLMDDVGAVPLSADPHLKADDIAFLLTKIHKPDGGHHLKLYRSIPLGIHLIDHRFDFGYRAYQILLGDHLPADLDTLPEFQHIGGDKHTRFVTGLGEHAVEHGSGGTFSVGTSDVDVL